MIGFLGAIFGRLGAAALAGSNAGALPPDTSFLALYDLSDMRNLMGI